MEVWSGQVTGAADLSHGKGISLLVDPTLISHCALQKDARLSLRSFVNPTLIPYYARIGPALEVHIKDFKSIEWWKCRLLSGVGDEDEDADDRVDDPLPIQCPTGVLLAVETPQRRGSTSNTLNNDVTDILVYGVLGLTSLHSKRPPTPPSSSPTFPDPTLENSNDNEGSAPGRELRIYAVTLCSGLISMAKALPSPPFSPNPGSFTDNNDDNDNDNDNDYDNETYAEFLPEQRSPCPKRKRMASIFDAATEYHKKVRRKGGQAVSQLMSRSLSLASGHQLSKSAIAKIKKEPLDTSFLDKGNNINNNGDSSTHKPRMLSISRITKTPKQSSSATPLSTHLRDSSSNIGARPRTASVSSWRSTPGPFAPQQQQQQQQQDRQIPSPPQLAYSSPSETISANKTLLTRTILTCMRLYGFHRNSRTNNPAATSSQSKQPPLPGSTDVDSPVVLPTKTTVPTPMPTHAQTEKPSQSYSRPSTATAIPAAAPPDTEEDDDFKAMYHAAYRAASFALRRYLKDVTNGSTGTGGSAVAGTNGLNNASSETGGGMGVPLLERGKATDLVDGILRLFCET
ncbi:hypothetical protein BDBG_07759 [Blastomyces gilchristii SLH14081]|uniref:Sld7 C-terminal domain-containing protein n=2 Tax=Blastomyces TaxID=229219 RepID=A0A179UYX2_BLAGS|nr:uncharacterized protein BDBG_07759 [Blastomyces gilchristii SLH14081]EGE83658.1 hypothetical protein BDDG_06602 [Blastomyces dermatitidis ATCC 18188]OAT12419.1 hypothetical protein BDBG_07759 [Blastomyces gilchristii SLH14081]